MVEEVQNKLYIYIHTHTQHHTHTHTYTVCIAIVFVSKLQRYAKLSNTRTRICNKNRYLLYFVLYELYMTF